MVSVKKDNGHAGLQTLEEIMKNLFNKNNCLLLSILALGFALRIWGISFGLPDLFRYDEITHVEIALKLGSSGLNPGSFTHGSLLYYVLFCEYLPIYLFQHLFGLVASPTDFLVKNYITDPSMLFLAGRVAQAIFGTGIIIIIYMIGKRLFNKRIGLISAYLLSISFMHVQASHYIKAEMLSSFLLMVGFLFAIHIIYKDNLKYYLLAGLFIGLSTAAKYYACLGYIFLITVHLLSNWELSYQHKYRVAGLAQVFLKRKFVLASFMVLAGFLIGQPYVLLDFKTFMANFIFVVTLGNHDFIQRTVGLPQIWFFFYTLLNNAIGLPVLLGFLISFSLMFKKEYRKKLLILLCFPLFYLIGIFFSSVSVDRYLCPIVPFLVVSAAVFVDWLARKPPVHKNVVLIIAIIILSLPMIDVLRYERLITKKDTRAISRKWIEETIPEGATVAIEGTGGSTERLITWGPNIKGDLFSLQEEYDAVIAGGGSGRLMVLKIEHAQKDRTHPRYRLFKTYIADKKFIERYNPDYIILNSYSNNWDWYRFNRTSIYDIIESKYTLVKEFKASPEMRWDYHYQMDFKNLRRIKIFDFKQKIISGPNIYVYKRLKKDE